MVATTLEMARDERTEFAAFLETLSEEDWATPSLCEGWSVRDVAAHVISYDELSFGDSLLRFARAGFNLGRSNEARIAEVAKRSPQELVALYRKYADPRGALRLMGGRVALMDAFIHQQDIRRPLGRPREIPADRVTRVLEYAFGAPPIPVKRNARGLRVVASDMEWQRGEGPEVRGPGEALLMTLAGRGAALDDLSGPGLSTLAPRVGRTL